MHVEDISEQVAALALQGPTSARRAAAPSPTPTSTGLKYFRVTSGTIAGVPVDISRTGYTGDLGYEIWMPAEHAVRVWDALMDGGRPFDIKPAGMLALDVARVEAGLLLIDVDFFSSKKALIDGAELHAVRDGPRPARQPRQGPVRRPQALARRARARPARGRSSASRSTGPTSSAIYEQLGLAPPVGATASRVAVPVYKGGRQVGRATTTTWSPVLKKLIALATIDRPHFAAGTALDIEITVEAVRHRVGATVVQTPFFNPPRKTATPPG